MALALTSVTLEDFLAHPDLEESPAWELVDGRKIQKPMPTLFHSRLQRNLVNWLNAHGEAFEAIQELRCIIPPHSPVPDIVVIARDRIPEEDGPFYGAPDWLIEIRSPDQSTLSLQAKILHCLQNGTQAAWLIDLDRQQIWVWEGDELPTRYTEDDRLSVPGFGLDVAIADIFSLAHQRR
ncbi:MAG: Uma2 family endonuclease [Cyanobacteria bacterium]|nr:Uma2 family endonuclease [Cyanobacteriota bacterium]